MKRVARLSVCLVASMALLSFSLVGCGTPQEGTPTALEENSTAGHEDADGEHDHGSEAAHDHQGWWCSEHGVPEEECTRCDFNLIGDFKAKGDWCDEHARPHSQCFLCDPELEGKFAARYEAKYGEQPPKPSDP